MAVRRNRSSFAILLGNERRISRRFFFFLPFFVACVSLTVEAEHPKSHKKEAKNSEHVFISSSAIGYDREFLRNRSGKANNTREMRGATTSTWNVCKFRAKLI